VKRPKVILFDIGETLVHFAGLNWPNLFRQGTRAGRQYLLAQGLRLPPEEHFVNSLLWRGRKALLLNRLSRREIDIAQLFAVAVGGLRGQMSQPLWREFILRLYQPLAEGGQLDGQTLPVLGRLREEGFRIGLISNTFVPSYAMDQHLERLGLLALLDYRFYSAEVGLKKPSLSLFRQVVREVGVRPGEAWHVGNDLLTDVLGARRAGLTAVMRLRPGRRVGWWWLIKPHHVIHELSDLLTLLRLRRR